MNDLDVGAVLRKIDSCLAAQGKKKQEFYTATGISSASYSQWNKGVCVPSQLSLAKAAEFLGMTYDELVLSATKKSASSEDKAVSMAFPTDLVRLTDKDQRDLYKIFSAAVAAKNITEGFAVSHANVDVTMLIRLQARYLSMAKRSELIRLANFLEVQDAALPLIQELPALEENLAALYRQLHDQIDRIDPDDILTVSEVLQALTKSRKK